MGFMAPEMVASQMRGGVYNEKVDVWSLGMLLFELITLDLPYRRNELNHFELPKQIAQGVKPKVDPALAKNASLAPLWKLFEQLTEVDAERRLSAHQAAKR